MDKQFHEIQRLQNVKGHDYSGKEDTLSHIKTASRELGLTFENIWAVFTRKHWLAVMTYCKEGQVQSEPVQGRLQDIIVYCLLLLAYIHECEERAAILALDAEADSDD